MIDDRGPQTHAVPTQYTRGTHASKGAPTMAALTYSYHPLRWAEARRRLYATEQGLTQLGVGSGVAPSAESGGGSGAASPPAR